MRKSTMKEICHDLRTTPMQPGASGYLFDPDHTSESPKGCALGALVFKHGCSDGYAYRRKSLDSGAFFATEYIVLLYPGISMEEACAIATFYNDHAKKSVKSFANVAAWIEETMLDPEDIPVEAPTHLPLDPIAKDARELAEA